MAKITDFIKELRERFSRKKKEEASSGDDDFPLHLWAGAGDFDFLSKAEIHATGDGGSTTSCDHDFGGYDSGSGCSSGD